MKTETLCPDIGCDHSIAERPRYYARQLITDETLRLEQQYFIDKMRRHNRLLHGYGVVCGAQICLSTGCKTNGSGNKPWEVVVKPGYILGPYGDEIIIDCERVVDLRTRGVSGVTGEPCVAPDDPWCSDVHVPRDPQAPLFVAVKYKECQTRPVRVQPIGCGCDDNQCEYSRWRDGYEIGILTCCPEPGIEQHQLGSIKSPVGTIGVTSSLVRLSDNCPLCPTEPWVVLGRVRVNANGDVTEIDNCECRRIVVSFGSLAVTCETLLPQVAIEPDSINPNSAAQKDKLDLSITGKNFQTGTCVDLGTGIKVDNEHATVEAGGNTLKVSIEVDEYAQPGKRTLTLINPDCATSTLAEAFEVKRSTAPQMAAQPEAAASPSMATTSGKRSRTPSRSKKGK